MEEQKIIYPIHKMGKLSGYEEYEDGSIEIAPKYAERMETIVLSEIAINNLLDVTIKSINKLYLPLEKEKRQIWVELRKDYLLDFEKYDYTYVTKSKRIKKVKKEPPINES